MVTRCEADERTDSERKSARKDTLPNNLNATQKLSPLGSENNHSMIILMYCTPNLNKKLNQV